MYPSLQKPATKKEQALLAKRETKLKLQQSLDSFKQGQALVRSAASRADLEHGIQLLTLAISSRPRSACPCA